MAGLTSQPSINALVSALRGHPREAGLTNKALQPLANYWEDVREIYSPFESGLKSSTSEVYYHEIPGGQYSNLRPQVAEMGLLHRWNDVKDCFALVNLLVGDIPKVTPSSKMVGDFAIFLLKNDLAVRRGSLEEAAAATMALLLERAPRLDFPSSVVEYFQGKLGHPPFGFPEDLQKAVLKGLPVVTGRPSASMPPLDLETAARDLSARFNRRVGRDEAVSQALYPRVMEEFWEAFGRYEDVSILDSPTYFYGLVVGQEISVEMERGKTLVVSLEAVGEPDADGMRTVYFTLNGHARQVVVRDRARASSQVSRRRAEPGNLSHVGASMPGTVIALHRKPGDRVETGTPLLTLEAMKMETVVRAPRGGVIKEVVPSLRGSVQAGDLLVLLESPAA
jgi:pyruvate carboxylase